MDWCVINHKDDGLLSEHMQWILDADVRLAASELKWLKDDNIPFDHEGHMSSLSDFEVARENLLGYLGYDEETASGMWLLLVLENGVPVAMTRCVNTNVDEVWSISSVYVDEAYRSNGIGRGMVEFVRNTAKENGGKQIQLSVYTRNKKAHSLYSKLGFKSYMEEMALAL